MESDYGRRATPRQVRAVELHQAQAAAGLQRGEGGGPEPARRYLQPHAAVFEPKFPEGFEPMQPRVEKAKSREPVAVRSSLLEENLTAEGRMNQIKNMSLASGFGGPNANNASVKIIRSRV